MSQIHRRFAAIFSLGFALSACGSDDEPAVQKPSYVLVHGAWMGAWGWSDVSKELRTSGSSVTEVELPAHGSNTEPVSSATLDAYVTAVSNAIDEAPAPVILVGHSMAGVVITETAERKPDSLERLVYLAAYLPKDGETLQALAATDADSHIGPALKIDPENGVASIPLDALADIFCADCSNETLVELHDRYRDEPLAPFATPVHTTAEGWGRVPKHYVFTTDDHAITPALQNRMIEGVDLTGTTTLQTSHSPFLSNPSAVVAALRAL